MPTIAAAYIVVFAVVSVLGIADDAASRRPLWWMVAGILSSVATGYLFVAYWLPDLRAPLGLGAVAMVVAAAAWEVCSAISDIRRETALVNELSEAGGRWVMMGAVTLYTFTTAPAFLIAGASALTCF